MNINNLGILDNNLNDLLYGGINKILIFDYLDYISLHHFAPLSLTNQSSVDLSPSSTAFL